MATKKGLLPSTLKQIKNKKDKKDKRYLKKNLTSNKKIPKLYL